MHIAILSQKPDSYSCRRLVEAIEKAGHRASMIDYMRCVLSIAAHRPKVRYQGETLEDIDAIIPRIAAEETFYGNAVVRQFEMAGVYTVNSSQAISRSRDKLRSLQLLSRKGLGLPVTTIAHSTQHVEELIEGVGGAPLIIKLIEGMQGIGVVLAETRQAAKSVIEAFRSLQANILVQEFIAEAEGADYRCFVIGDRVVASMKRQGPQGEFRSNIHRGGSAQKAKLTPEERSTAVRAAQAMGLKVAGVDILRSNHGPLVMEVNSSPGLEGIEGATEKDIAGAVVTFIEKNTGTPKQDRIKG
jgi:ribosomal protein S6--L-glutamate ligase